VVQHLTVALHGHRGRAADPLTGRIREDSMNQGTHPEGLTAEVLDDVASAVGAEVTLLSRLPAGLHVGAMRVPVGRKGRCSAQNSARAHPGHLGETLRAQRVVEHMRGRGYPTRPGLEWGPQPLMYGI
jgi:hypothetical protein